MRYKRLIIYLEFLNSRLDLCITLVLFAFKMIIHPDLSITNNQKSSTYFTHFHMLFLTINCLITILILKNKK